VPAKATSAADAPITSSAWPSPRGGSGSAGLGSRRPCACGPGGRAYLQRAGEHWPAQG
jgi:hypothetical protein